MFAVKSFEFNPLQENTWLLYNEFNECIIIDPGAYFDDEKEELKKFIEEKKLQPVYLLNTHCHLDHVFANKFVAETWGLKLSIHPGEKEVLEHAPVSGLMYNVPFDNYTGEIIPLQPGSEISIGDDTLKILFTPGHSPASVSFYCAAQKFVIGGDVLFSGSIGRTDLPGGSFEVLEKSIREEFYTLPDDTVIHPGHGPSTTVGAEKRSNPFVSGG